MADDELRELTASEPLSLDEEYEMQKKWQIDEDKLTFIILARNEDTKASAALTEADIKSFSMIGDVNLFFKGSPEDEDFEVEVEIMIAEPTYRRQGLASHALQLLLSYATSPSSSPPLPIHPQQLVARIGDKNVASIGLFRNLGFVVTKHVHVFEEVEMRLKDEDGVVGRWIKGDVIAYR